MRLRYFLVDESGELRKAAQATIEGAWEGTRPLDDLPGRRSVGIITVLSDDAYGPLQCFQTRVNVVDGQVTEQSIDDAHHAWFLLRPPLNIPGSASKPREDPWSNPVVTSQLSGWPDRDDLRRQLAVALDIPVDHVPEFYIGGPLITARQLHISIRQAITYFPARPHN